MSESDAIDVLLNGANSATVTGQCRQYGCQTLAATEVEVSRLRLPIHFRSISLSDQNLSTLPPSKLKPRPKCRPSDEPHIVPLALSLRFLGAENNNAGGCTYERLV